MLKYVLVRCSTLSRYVVVRCSTLNTPYLLVIYRLKYAEVRTGMLKYVEVRWGTLYYLELVYFGVVQRSTAYLSVDITWVFAPTLKYSK